MTSWQKLTGQLRLPLVGAPMFLVSNPELVIAQCKAGVIGSFPALNARPAEELDRWLQRITEALDRHNQAHPERPAAPFAVNQIVHKTNVRLEQDLALCRKYAVPIVITSLAARPEINEAVHAWGGITLHDVINNRFARKAIDKGADGLIAVSAGAGGHAGTTSPLALIQEIREWFDGPLLLSGAISTGASLLAARAMGADLGYAGSVFLATHESSADQRHKQMLADCSSADIVYSDLFTGIHANYLAPSIRLAGMDPQALPNGDPADMSFQSEGEISAKAWKDIWGCGQGIHAVKGLVSAAEVVDRMEREYRDAVRDLSVRTADVTCALHPASRTCGM